MEYEIEELFISDYEEIYSLWEKCEGVGLSDADSKESIERYIKRNEGMSFVARSSNRIVATILAGHDGRRGYIHHLAVHDDFRRNGIGKELVKKSLEVISKEGINKCHIFVFKENDRATKFWTHEDWKIRDDLNIISKGIEQNSACELLTPPSSGRNPRL